MREREEVVGVEGKESGMVATKERERGEEYREKEGFEEKEVDGKNETYGLIENIDEFQSKLFVEIVHRSEFEDNDL